MLRIPLITGYSPIRWQRATYICLRKKEGELRVDKTRIIVLYEADFNFTNKWIGKEMMKKSEKGKLLSIEKYGSRNNKSMNLQALNKKLMFDISRQKRIDYALCGNDDKHL